MEIVIPNIPYYLSNGLIAEFKRDLEAADNHRDLLHECLHEMEEYKTSVMENQPCGAESLPWHAEYARAKYVFDVLERHNEKYDLLVSRCPQSRRFDKLVDTMTLMDELYGEDYLYFWSSYVEKWEGIVQDFYKNLGYWKKQKQYKTTKNKKTKKIFLFV